MVSTYTCAVLIHDAKASRGGALVFRACGAPSRFVVTIGGDTLFAVCQRHDRRLARAGIQFR